MAEWTGGATAQDITLRQVAAEFILGEAPRWYPDTGLLLSDMVAGGVFAVTEGGPPRMVLGRRRGIGGLVGHAAGGIIVGGRDLSHSDLTDPLGPLSVLHSLKEGEEFVNDVATDALGRVWFGTVASVPRGLDDPHRAPGALYRLDLDGRVHVMADDPLLSNGLACDQGGHDVFHVDSARRVVWRYHQSLPTDDAPPRRSLFVETREYGGLPDGLALAVDGTLFVAIAGAGLVVGWAPTGERVIELEVPDRMVTAVCFGGPDHRTLYVTTGDDGDPPRVPRGGVFAFENTGFRGQPLALARVGLDVSRRSR